MQRDGQGRNSEQVLLAHWLRLEQLPHLGVSKLLALLFRYTITVEELFCADSSTLEYWGFTPSQIAILLSPNQRYIERSIAWQSGAPNRFILPFGHSADPRLLREITVPPMVIYGCGEVSLLSTAQIAIVGSRNPSPSGKENARYFSSTLSQEGWTITSGLALGIDYIYPRRYTELAARIVENNGALISEFAPDTPVHPANFPRRNRIISGLSLGTLIVEAAIKSGSFITARCAIEQDREVFAVPGNIHNTLSKGCHYLLQQGAKLVENVGDINDEFKNLNIWKEDTSKNKTKKLLIKTWHLTFC